MNTSCLSLIVTFFLGVVGCFSSSSMQVFCDWEQQLSESSYLILAERGVDSFSLVGAFAFLMKEFRQV
ncbi:hypothetical protein FGO68_gene17606 [Halteria grandinella]|uniref:Uncharacterized protein n=1 Tax=Halteria grandinella TaxID=5974 RepID=A0A8J8P0K7_HALGN|nr:hypothetical protein FGO68_gene17606 [Halteria grandinella]